MISSQFRHCPKSTDSRHRLSVWAWILVAVGAVLLLLLLFGGVLAFIHNSKRNLSQLKESAVEQGHPDEEGNDQVDVIFKLTTIIE